MGQYKAPSKQTYYPNKKRVDRGRGYKRVAPDSSHVEVYDIDLAAWFHMNNVAIVDAFKRGKEAIVTFYDPIDQSRISELSVSWLNAESAKFAGAVRQIKKICLSSGRQRGQP